MTSILGISAFYHDSAAALIADGKIVSAVQEERFSRKKHDADYPSNAVNYILKSNSFCLNYTILTFLEILTLELDLLPLLLQKPFEQKLSKYLPHQHLTLSLS